MTKAKHNWPEISSCRRCWRRCKCWEGGRVPGTRMLLTDRWQKPLQRGERRVMSCYCDPVYLHKFILTLVRPRLIFVENGQKILNEIAAFTIIAWERHCCWCFLSWQSLRMIDYNVHWSLDVFMKSLSWDWQELTLTRLSSVTRLAARNSRTSELFTPELVLTKQFWHDSLVWAVRPLALSLQSGFVSGIHIKAVATKISNYSSIAGSLR